MPTEAEIAAVRRVFRRGKRRLRDDLGSIDALLHLDGDASQGPPRQGFSGIKKLEERFRNVAEEVRAIRAGLEDVEFDPDDKREIQAALAETARAWDARARLVRAKDPSLIRNTLGDIRAYENASAQHGGVLRAYLPEEDGN